MNKEILDTLEGPLEFTMNFRTIKELDNRYGHQEAIKIFDNIRDFNSKEFTDSVLRVLECCCITKILAIGELEKILSPSFENIIKIDSVALKLVLGFLGTPDQKEEEEVKK